VIELEAYMLTDCGEPTTGFLDSEDKPLLIFLDEEQALKRQDGIVGELYVVKIKRIRKSNLRDKHIEDYERREYKRLKAKFEPEERDGS